MEKYEQIAIVGEGSYGVVVKCRHKASGQIVAIKKFLETDEDVNARKMTFREIRILKKLKHENIIAMIEVFRYRKRFYLVFEYVEGTVLDELDKKPGGLGEEASRRIIFQVTRAIHYCHFNNIIHRDIKPENILVSSRGVVKLCDFGFARLVSLAGEQCTEYVATRWYRAPELLVGDVNYAAPVDIWAIGCILAEIMSGNALLPGDSDIDQLYITIRLFGKPCTKHLQLMNRNNELKGMIKSADRSGGLRRMFHSWPPLCIELLTICLKMDPQERPTASEILHHEYFTHDNFSNKFLPVIRDKVMQEMNENPLLRRIKRDVFHATDNVQDYKLKRNIEPRWKINLSDPNSIKRKFSCDLENQPQELLNRTLSKTTPSTVQIGFNTPSNPSEIQMLQKTLESLNKFSQKNDFEDKTEDLHSYECEGALRKSLQVNASILHPITKKSPNLTESLHVNSYKTVNSSKNLIYLKKSNQTHDINLIAMKSLGVAPWVNAEKLTRRKKQSDFSLPNLPGAIRKTIHKTESFEPNIHFPSIPGVTINQGKLKEKSPEVRINSPRIQSSTSQKSTSSRHLDFF